MMRLQGQIPGRPGLWEVILENDKVAGVRPVSSDAWSGTEARRESTEAVWISSGWLDIQINGYGGHVLNDKSLTAAGVEGSVRALWPTGTALSFLTLTTGSPERLLQTARTLGRVLADGDPQVRASIAGLHLEGPYISAVDGPRGAHGRDHVRPPSWDEFQRLQEACGGHIRLVTLAPELPGAIEFIEKATAQGIVIALGHTNAEREDILNASGAGARLSTHLGNGAHAQIRRHPNYIWEQLACDTLYASLIPDGYHLPPAVLKTMIRAKGIHRSILTTDASGVTGLPPGQYHVQERDVELRPGGPVLLSGTDYLAGSALQLNDGIANTVGFAGVNLGEAVDMVTINPGRLMGLEERTGHLRSGQEANLTVFTTGSDGSVRIEQTIVKGEVVFDAQN